MKVGPLALPDDTATAALAAALARALMDPASKVGNGLVIYLYGELGAGKTSFARALLRTLGVAERIKSPTYSLVESYLLTGGNAFHLDLYRIADPGELEWLGLDALADPAAVILVEWPERGRGALPPADIALHLAYAGAGRQATFESLSPGGSDVLARL